MTDGKSAPSPPFEASHELQKECDRLMAENMRLHKLLETHGIDYSQFSSFIDGIVEDPLVDPASVEKYSLKKDESCSISKFSASEEKIALFAALFQGRGDVYAKQWQSKDGKVGYSPACKNEWIPGVCGKPKTKCAKCSHAVYHTFDDDTINRHLRGDHVIGIYPLLPDDTCLFLVIDFDEASWQKDVCAVVEVCENNCIPHAIEISRSCNGAHLWFFFDSQIAASQARGFGS